MRVVKFIGKRIFGEQIIVKEFESSKSDLQIQEDFNKFVQKNNLNPDLSIWSFVNKTG